MEQASSTLYRNKVATTVKRAHPITSVPWPFEYLNPVWNSTKLSKRRTTWYIFSNCYIDAVIHIKRKFVPCHRGQVVIRSKKLKRMNKLTITKTESNPATNTQQPADDKKYLLVLVPRQIVLNSTKQHSVLFKIHIMICLQ